MGEMIRYQKKSSDIIRKVEIDLTKVTDVSRQDLESRVTKYLEHEGKKIFAFKGDKLVYETEILIPRTKKDRLNLLVVLGNPAVHSVVKGMFFSYEKTRAEGKWREHRFCRALRDCDVLTFYEDIGKPTPENIAEMNARKRNLLLKGEYRSDFNIFLLPYFSFPTSASRGYNGVNGIRMIVGEDIFEKMKAFEFRRFEGIVLCNDIKNVICFQKTDVGKEIIQKADGEQIDNLPNSPVYPVY